jgi:apolipoprotein N-acyltransferase
MVIGADDAEPGATPEEEPRYYNSAWLISPEGKLHQTYRKQKLVAFGEEVPFSTWLPFLKWLTPITGSFTRGTVPVAFVLKPFNVNSPSVIGQRELSAIPPSSITELNLAPSICFEDVFPALVRRSVQPDTDLLVNLTNDGWFREGAAQRQQAAAAVFRAVENGRPLVRCTNNGLTCWVDRFGRTVETFVDDWGTIHGAGWTVFTVKLDPTLPGTAYQRHGDAFAWACFALTLGVAGWLGLRGRWWGGAPDDAARADAHERT